MKSEVQILSPRPYSPPPAAASFVYVLMLGFESSIFELTPHPARLVAGGLAIVRPSEAATYSHAMAQSCRYSACGPLSRTTDRREPREAANCQPLCPDRGCAPHRPRLRGRVGGSSLRDDRRPRRVQRRSRPAGGCAPVRGPSRPFR